MQNVIQVACEIFVGPQPLRVVVRQRVFVEHVDPIPRWRSRGCSAEAGHQLIHELPHPGGLEGQNGSDQAETGRLFPEDSGCPVRTDHFVVAHVYDPQIPVVPGAFPGDGEKHMGVDRGHRHADHLEFGLRIPDLEQSLQIAAHPEGWIRVPIGGGFAEEENPVSPRRLRHGHPAAQRFPGQSRREKPAGEFFVGYEKFLAVDCAGEKQAGWVAVAGQAQAEFQPAENEERHQRCGGQSHPPASAGVGRLFSDATGLGRPGGLHRAGFLRFLFHTFKER